MFGCIDIDSNEAWAKEIINIGPDGNPLQSPFVANNGGAMMINDQVYVYSIGQIIDSTANPITHVNVIFQTKYSLNGDFVEQKSFKPIGLPYQLNILQIEQYNYSGEYNYVITLNEEFKDGVRYLSTFIMRFHQYSNDVATIKLDFPATHYNGSSVFDESGNIYLSMTGYVTIPDISYLYPEFLLFKIDSSFNLDWIRYYKAEEFLGRPSSVIVYNDTISLSLATHGHYPVILAQLNAENGEIYSTNGYSFFSPQFTNLLDGRIAVGSSGYYDSEGFFRNNFQLSVSNDQGNLTECSPEPACLISDYLNLDWTTVMMQELPIIPYDFPDLEVIAIPMEVEYEEGCNAPTFPEPSFQISQTLCIQDTLSITNLKNQLANGYEWQLTGPDNYEQHFDNENPENITLAEPGTYYLRQTIYVLGCAYEYEQLFEVIDEASVASETITVCEFPAEVTLQSNCDSTDIRWDDGSIGSRTVTAPGDYAVTVCSGLCANEFLISVRPASELLPDPLFLLPADTAICPRDFPLQIDAPPDLVTTLNGEPAPLRLDAPGSYRLGYLIDDCLYEQPLTLTAADCTPRLFIPNAFSPNNDGVNDYLELSGNENLELRMLEVYDRWGARVYRQLGGRLRWDGRVEGNPAGAGTYVVRVVYVEVHTGEEVELAQDVALLR